MPAIEDKTVVPQSQLDAITILRGCFVFLVCLYHFLVASKLFVECWDCTSIAFQLAWPACYCFFLISGYGITWSLYRGDYEMRHAPRFYLKRIIRVEPPYLFSILLILLARYLWSLTSYEAESFHVGLRQLALHVLYLISFTDYKWINPVFWTLAVEFQFYITLALVYPLLMHRDWRVRTAFMAALVALSAVTPHLKNVVVSYIPLFLMGIVLLHYHIRLSGKRELAAWMAVLLVATLKLPFGATTAAVAVLSMALIMADRHYSRIAKALGELSYSIYLMHMITGLAAIRILLGWSTATWAKLLALLLAYVFSIASAWLLWCAIERPSQRLSQRIRYPRRPALPGVARDAEVTPAPPAA